MLFKKTIIPLVLSLFLAAVVQAQEMRLPGKVYAGNKSGQNVLPGALVRWIGTQTTATADAGGHFEILWNIPLPAALVASLPGYIADTLWVNALSDHLDFELQPMADLKEVTVTAKREDIRISTLKPIQVEEISQGELLKAACCNVSESFETNPSVDVNYADAITGIREIQLLGLSGNYTQILTENIPSYQGLSVPYGLSFIPGSWLESIQISKGAGSVANGSQAITGQINVEMVKPEKAAPFFLNVYSDHEGRFELNTINRFDLDKKWKYVLMAHADYSGRRLDHNSDGFLDQPLSRQLNVYNRFQYHSGKKLESQFGIKALLDEKVGGEKDFDVSEDKGTTNRYGFGTTTKRMEFYSKTGFIYPSTPWKSMGLQLDAVLHNQDSYFGQKEWKAEEKTIYANYSYINILGTTDHKIKAGADFRIDKWEETWMDSLQARTQRLPGIFSEYSYGGDSLRFGLVAGARVENNSDYGWFFVPRMHLKYNLSPELIWRISGGRGLRTPNAIADQIYLLASSKKLVFAEEPRLEDAWNYGTNVTWRFKMAQRDASLTGDYYHTAFNNQFIFDAYSSPDSVYFFNAQDATGASSLQFAFNWEILPNTDIRLAWKNDLTQIVKLNGEQVDKPLVAQQKMLLHLAWKNRLDLWRISATLQWEGKKPLPPAAASHVHGESDYSPAYFQLLAQVTRVFRTWECYLGGDNLLNYTQHQPILGSADPFGSSFDATRVWGPVMGTKIYAGIRLTLQ